MDKTYSAECSPELLNYLNELLLPEDHLWEEVSRRSKEFGLPQIHLSPIDARHLEVIARVLKPKRIVEIGTLAGYTTTRLARSLEPGGCVFTLEINELNQRVALDTFRIHGVEGRVKLLPGPALDSLKELESEGPFDLVFIDADKANYPAYARWSMEQVRIGGVIVGDNTLAVGWGGITSSSPHPERQKSLVALREFNSLLAHSPSFRTTLLPTGEGMTIAVRIA